MFKLSLSPTFWAIVEIDIAAEGGGRTVAKFDLQYKRLTLDESKAMADRIGDGETDPAVIARELVVGWRSVGNEDGSALDFNAENFDKMLGLGFGRQIVETFTRNLPKAKQKN